MAATNPIARIERIHSIYRIVSARRGDLAEASAYAGSRRLFTVSATTMDEAAQDIARRLEARRRRFNCARRDGVPTCEEFRDLLDALPAPWSLKLLPQLQAHAALPDAEATAAEIARHAGCEAHQVWWSYGRLGRKLVSALGARPPRGLADEPPDVRAVLAFAELRRGPSYGDWMLRLRPEPLAALGHHHKATTASERRRA